MPCSIFSGSSIFLRSSGWTAVLGVISMMASTLLLVS